MNEIFSDQVESPSSESLAELIDVGPYNDFAFLFSDPIESYLNLIASTSSFYEESVIEKYEIVEKAIANYQESINFVPDDEVTARFVDGIGVIVDEQSSSTDNGMSLEDFRIASNFLIDAIGIIRNGQFSFAKVHDIDQMVYEKTRIVNDLIAIYEIFPKWQKVL
ncbi:hypothetical protein MF271_23905 (plasmid) [Deinococcus sp. KNUC1210]|uniref:hypothetical protein n=1 Tax=Deinococcus sp. KNUC1210 TaxID=2917691 RepID=UPI001EEFAF6C|nr:hypothetical protein [Deinococcus sp. KNUC1210]ULH18009.1 hypothetical protein MF271_23905 [Deinococcus sp. KNUC1210]